RTTAAATSRRRRTPARTALGARVAEAEARWMVGAVTAIMLLGCDAGGASGDVGGAGGGTAGAGGAACVEPGAVGDLPCDIAAVLEARCQSCHGTPLMKNAKFPLERYEDAHAPFGTTGKRRWQRIAEVIEPGGLPHMPKDWSTKGELTTEQLETLRAWVGSCA